jgi:hypothetical protein
MQMYGSNTITDVRDRIEEKIGQYLGLFENGDRALWVMPPTPPEFGSGVHCIIHRNSVRLGLTSNYEWIINLIFVAANLEAVDEANQVNFDQCLKEIRYWFPRSREIHSTYQGFYPQINFYFNYEKEAYNL